MEHSAVAKFQLLWWRLKEMAGAHKLGVRYPLERNQQIPKRILKVGVQVASWKRIVSPLGKKSLCAPEYKYSLHSTSVHPSIVIVYIPREVTMMNGVYIGHPSPTLKTNLS